MSATAASARPGPAMPTDVSTQRMLRMEHFLDAVLRRELQSVLLRRESASAIAAQCRHVRDLIDSIVSLGAAKQQQQHMADAAAAGFASSRTSASSSGLSSTSAAPLSTELLTNIGNHFYMQCVVPDARTIHINIGSGVVLPMPLADAKAFLVLKEELLVQDVVRLTRESLRVRFRMRLVMEAISRLNDASMGRRGALP
jgi:hypothetical protein